MLGWPEIIIIGGVAFIFLGPKRLPEFAKSIGQGIKEFKKATKEGLEEISDHPSTIKICPSCSNPLKDESAAFCPKCGKSLTPPPSPPA